MNKGHRAGEDALGIDVEKGKSYYWCSCGKSSKQPFCDGSHKGTEFNPVAHKAEETKKMFFFSPIFFVVLLRLMISIFRNTGLTF